MNSLTRDAVTVIMFSMLNKQTHILLKLDIFNYINASTECEVMNYLGVNQYFHILAWAKLWVKIGYNFNLELL